MERGQESESESIGGLFARLADDASALIRAEVNVYRAEAMHRLAVSRAGLILIATAVLLILAALTSLLTMVAIALTPRCGPLGAGLIVAIVVLVGAYVLIRMGMARLAHAADSQPESER